MDLPSAVAEVLRATARPDKAVAAALAINRAISYCTLKGEFSRDLVETTFPIDATLYGNTVSISTLTRFRRFAYIKPTGVKYYLTPTSGDKIFTPKDQMQPNVYYIAGTSLTYTLSALNSSLELSYYTYPAELTGGNPNHWMLDIMPYAITELAAAKIFADIGDDASAKSYSTSGTDLFLIARRDLTKND